MKNHILSVVLISFILFSCGNKSKKEVPVNSMSKDASIKVEFSSLSANPDQFIGRTISVEGKVVHVCTETGKKMFIVGDNPDIRLFVAAGENISKFPLELLGSNIIVEGLITKPLRETAVNKDMEKMDGKHKMMNADSCETEKAMTGQSTLADIVMEYKSHSVK